MTTLNYFRQALESYAECALWASTHFENENDPGTPMRDVVDLDDISPELWRTFIQDLVSFVRWSIEANIPATELNPEHLGADLWLSQNRHGTGFWDQGYDHGHAWHEGAVVLGSVDLYIEDGLVYGYCG